MPVNARRNVGDRETPFFIGPDSNFRNWVPNHREVRAPTMLTREESKLSVRQRLTVMNEAPANDTSFTDLQLVPPSASWQRREDLRRHAPRGHLQRNRVEASRACDLEFAVLI